MVLGTVRIAPPGAAGSASRGGVADAPSPLAPASEKDSKRRITFSHSVTSGDASDDATSIFLSARIASGGPRSAPAFASAAALQSSSASLSLASATATGPIPPPRVASRVAADAASAASLAALAAAFAASFAITASAAVRHWHSTPWMLPAPQSQKNLDFRE